MHRRADSQSLVQLSLFTNNWTNRTFRISWKASNNSDLLRWDSDHLFLTKAIQLISLKRVLTLVKLLKWLLVNPILLQEEVYLLPLITEDSHCMKVVPAYMKRLVVAFTNIKDRQLKNDTETKLSTEVVKLKPQGLIQTRTQNKVLELSLMHIIMLMSRSHTKEIEIIIEI